MQNELPMIFSMPIFPPFCHECLKKRLWRAGQDKKDNFKLIALQTTTRKPTKDEMLDRSWTWSNIYTTIYVERDQIVLNW